MKCPSDQFKFKVGDIISFPLVKEWIIGRIEGLDHDEDNNHFGYFVIWITGERKYFRKILLESSSARLATKAEVVLYGDKSIISSS